MMNLLSKFLGWLEGLFIKKHSSTHSFHPYSDWFAILIASATLFLCVISIDGIIFYKIDRNELVTVPAAPSEVMTTFDRARLGEENKAYDAQAQRFNAIKMGSSSIDVVDPSL